MLVFFTNFVFVMGTIITTILIIYIITSVISFIFSESLLISIFNILKYLLIFICLPIVPFIVAYKNKKEHPIQSKMIVILQSILYASIFFILVLYFKSN